MLSAHCRNSEVSFKHVINVIGRKNSVQEITLIENKHRRIRPTSTPTRKLEEKQDIHYGALDQNTTAGDMIIHFLKTYLT